MFAVVLTLLLTTAPALQRQERLDFAVDEALQAQGGVQYFYELAAPTDTPPEGSALARFRALDPLSKPGDSWQVMMSRLVYTVERDVSFFTEARARDVSWMRRVAPDMGVRREPDGTFLVTKTPGNRFSLEWFEAPRADEPALVRFLALVPGTPASVVVQKNSDFARVLGWRTAERSLTYTAHVPLGPGRTRVFVCTMSLLFHVPPFFLGGRERVHRESVEAAAALIEQLRAYDGP